MTYNISTHDPKKGKDVIVGTLRDGAFYRSVVDTLHYCRKYAGYGLQEDVVQRLRDLDCVKVVFINGTKKHECPFEIFLNKAKQDDLGHGVQWFISLSDMETLNPKPTISQKVTPAIGPEHAKIMIVMDSPIVNSSIDRVFDEMLAEAGIVKDECRITTVVQQTLPNNDFEVYYEGKGKARKPTSELAREKDRLVCDVAACSPNVIIACGTEALKAFTQFTSLPNYRGSVIETPYGKVIPTYPASYIIRDWKARPVCILDLKRARAEAATAVYSPMPYSLTIHPSITEIREFVSRARRVGEVSFDIETEANQVTCIGFSCDTQHAMTIPFWFGNSGSLWGEEQEIEIWGIVKKFLEDESIIKIAQNGTYDTEFLKRIYGINVRGFTWDTMLMAHTLQPELPKGLDFLASIYTDIVYYKDKIDSDKMDEYFEYNAKDALVTYRIYLAQRKELQDAALELFYKTHVHALIAPLSDMVERGVRFDGGRKEEVKARLEDDVVRLQGELEQAVGHALNINSSKQMKAWVYDELKMPVKKKLRKGKSEPTTTTDAETLEVLYGKTGNTSLKTVLEIRERKKLLSTYLDVKLDPDNRIRCSYNIAGTETGRLSSSATARGTGTNLQNIPNGIIKSLFTADEGYVLINADLSQAEARVVAHLAGESRLISIFDGGGDIHRKNASVIYRCAESVVTPQQREMAKRVVHASNYGMGYRTFARNAKITEREAEALLRQYFATYPRIKLWQQSVAEQLRKTRMLRTPFGRRRQFWSRWDDSMVKEGFAYVPQSTIADAVNLAIINIHRALRERTDIQLLLQVHDSIVAQATQEKVHEAVELLVKEMSVNIPLNGEFKIPVDVKVGLNWNDMVKYVKPEEC